jgi:hypothetical protein
MDVKARARWMEKTKFETDLAELCQRAAEIGPDNLLSGWTRPWFDGTKWGEEMRACLSYAHCAALCFQLDRALVYSEQEHQRVLKELPVDASSDGSSSSDDEEEERDEEVHIGQGCEVCGGDGHMLLCDICNKEYHMQCLRPPLRKVPKGDWYCLVCKQEQTAAFAGVRRPSTRGSTSGPPAAGSASKRKTPARGGKEKEESHGMRFPPFSKQAAGKGPFRLPSALGGEESSEDEAPAPPPKKRGRKRGRNETSSEEESEEEESEEEEEEEEEEAEKEDDDDKNGDDDNESSSDDSSDTDDDDSDDDDEEKKEGEEGDEEETEEKATTGVAEPVGKAMQPKGAKCCLCCKAGGIMKPVVESGPEFDGSFAHVHCVNWLPHASFKDTVAQTPVTNLDKVDKRRFRLVCAVCNEKKGACIQCMCKGCKGSAHVSCALNPKGQKAGFKLFIKGDKKCFFCPEHKDNQ